MSKILSKEDRKFIQQVVRFAFISAEVEKQSFIHYMTEEEVDRALRLLSYLESVSP